MREQQGIPSEVEAFSASAKWRVESHYLEKQLEKVNCPHEGCFLIQSFISRQGVLVTYSLYYQNLVINIQGPSGGHEQQRHWSTGVHNIFYVVVLPSEPTPIDINVIKIWLKYALNSIEKRETERSGKRQNSDADYRCWIEEFRVWVFRSSQLHGQ